MSEWKETTLGEISEKVQYGYTESAAWDPIGPKFLRITDIQNDFVDWNNVPFCKITENDFEKYKLDIGDVCIARTGNSTGATTVIKNCINAVFASYLIRFKLNKKIVDYRFIDFLLRSQKWKGFVNSVKSGSAQDGANAQVFSLFPIFLPPLPEQQSIAAILSSLDNKIDLLRRQNQTLEQLAQTIFKQWFVNEAEDDWETKKVKDVCVTITKGTTPTTLGRQFKKSGINFIKAESLTEEGAFIPEKFAFIDSDTDKLLKRSRIQEGDVIITIAGTIGRIGFVTEDVLPANTNQAIGIMRADIATISPYFLYCLFRTPEIVNDFDSRIVHAVQPNLSLGEIGDIEFKMPPKEKLNYRMKGLEPLFEKKNKNTNQIQTLTQLRDSLLPRLMSGRLRVG